MAPEFWTLLGSILTGLFVLELLTGTPSDVIQSWIGAQRLKRVLKEKNARIAELEAQLRQRDVSGVIQEQAKRLEAQSARIETLEAITTGDPTALLPRLRE